MRRSVAAAAHSFSISYHSPPRALPSPSRFQLAVYSPADQVLFSSNFFSAHAAPASPGSSAFDDGGWAAYGPDWQYYFDCMLAPVARQATTALDRLAINAVPSADDGGPLAALLAPLRAALRLVSDLTLGADDGAAEPLAVAVLAPMHGPCVRTSLTELVGRYGAWTAAQVAASSTAFVAVLYASAYGNTASLAQVRWCGILSVGPRLGPPLSALAAREWQPRAEEWILL